MKASIFSIAVIAGLVATTALAETTDVQHLQRYLNGASTDGMISFGFERNECIATATLGQKHEGTTTRDTVVSFNFGDLALDEFGITDYEVIGIAQLLLNLTDSAEPATSTLKLMSEDQATRETWVETIGNDAACEGTMCVATLSERVIYIIVAGPNASSRAEFVLSDLRQLAADCSTVSE